MGLNSKGEVPAGYRHSISALCHLGTLIGEGVGYPSCHRGCRLLRGDKVHRKLQNRIEKGQGQRLLCSCRVVTEANM